MAGSTSLVPVAARPRLLDQLQQAADRRFGRPEPGERYAGWARRFILFHGKRHPAELGAGEVRKFLQHVAHAEKDPVTAIEHAHEARMFLYHDLLHLQLDDVPLPQPPKLLDRVRHEIRVRHYSPRTEECYVEWTTRFIRFHGLRHPNTMGAAEIEMFLTDLAVNGHVSASTQNQAFCALLFLYQEVLGIGLPRLDALRARRPKRLPTVLGAEEVRELLDAVRGGEGVFRTVASLLLRGGSAPRGVLPAARS
jgi:Phage integrase, N-terminal SAM-like domain